MTNSDSNKYSQLIIYYFSGTGNAKNAAIWIKSVAEKRGVKSTLVNIDRFEKIEITKTSGKLLIGFCSPTHGFNLPPIALKFINKFPRIKDADVFILNTRGGLKLSKLFLPGLSGLAQIYPALIMLFKGFRIVGMQPLDLPSNWIILHPGLKEKVINSMYERYQGIVERFANKLLDGGKKHKALLSIPFDLAVAPIAVGYYFIGRFFLAKTLVATDDCNQCELCVKQCPVKAITMNDERPYWTYKCESCMRCINNCPQRAIDCFRMTCGMIEPSEGRVFLGGQEVTDWPMYRRAKDGGMGYLPQDPSVFTKLNVQQNLLGVMELLGMKWRERRARCKELLEQFKITKVRKSLASSLSGGERRRLEIARCLVSEPKIILLDEPFTGIDPVTIQSIQTIIRNLRSGGISILITDHQVRETLQITDRSYVIDEGEVLCQGPPSEVLAHPIARRKYFGDGIDIGTPGPPPPHGPLTGKQRPRAANQSQIRRSDLE